jgi:hypothetical protein
LILRPPGSDTWPSFLYVDEGAVTLSGFETALRRALPVLEQIHAFELIYLANHSGLFEKAEAIFRRIVLGLGNGSKQRLDIDRLIDYFAELERYENRQTADFDMRRLDRPSGVTSKPTIEGHFKTDQWHHPGQQFVLPRLVWWRQP